MDIWSGHISGDKQLGCEVNQAKGFAVGNGASASVCLEEPVSWFMYIAASPK